MLRPPKSTRSVCVSDIFDVGEIDGDEDEGIQNVACSIAFRYPCMQFNVYLNLEQISH